MTEISKKGLQKSFMKKWQIDSFEFNRCSINFFKRKNLNAQNLLLRYDNNHKRSSHGE